MVVLAVAASTIVIRVHHRSVVAPPPVATRPAVVQTKPSEPPPVAQVIEPAVARTYLDVVHVAYPKFPATQPLGMPLDLSQAAHLVLEDPVYLSSGPRADLWITRADAPATPDVLKEAVDPQKDVQVHVTRERVVFVHWMPSDKGPWQPWLICSKADQTFEAVSAAGRVPLPRQDYRWDKAMSWNENVVAPCATGVSILQLGPHVTESFHELAPADADRAQLSSPQILLDWKGLLAWLPWEDQKTGGHGAARFVDNAWTDLGESAGFPDKVLHLVPLNDGNVLILHANSEVGVQLSLAVLDRLDIDQKKIAELVATLSDPDDTKRQEAYKQLTTYGSGIWPILEKMLDDQEPEAKARLRLLLRAKTTPTLGGMVLIGDRKLRLAAHLSDGGTVFYADGGVSITNPDRPDDEPAVVAPAWISIRPGMPIQLLSGALVTDVTPGKSKIDVVGGDWLVTTDIRGPRRFIGNGLVQLLRKSESNFSDLIGEDRRGRWVFRKSAAASATQPTTQDTSSSDATLIIDPTLPDPTPRLPVWVFRNAKTVGWDKDGWPVAQRQSSYALHEGGWQLMEDKETVYNQPDGRAGSSEPGLGAEWSEQFWDRWLPARPMLVDPQGTRYFGGLTELRTINAKGEQTIWPLPPNAIGEGPVNLVRTKDGKLFLFNQPSRVLRIRPTPGSAEPFELEVTFTHNIPTVDHPTRIWVDPADRIIIAYGNKLAILFPSGYIPPAIVEKMLGEPDVGE
jgi:hypothetical protein